MSIKLLMYENVDLVKKNCTVTTRWPNVRLLEKSDYQTLTCPIFRPWPENQTIFLRSSADPFLGQDSNDLMHVHGPQTGLAWYSDHHLFHLIFHVLPSCFHFLFMLFCDCLLQLFHVGLVSSLHLFLSLSKVFGFLNLCGKLSKHYFALLTASKLISQTPKTHTQPF